MSVSVSEVLGSTGTAQAALEPPGKLLLVWQGTGLRLDLVLPIGPRSLQCIYYIYGLVFNMLCWLADLWEGEERGEEGRAGEEGKWPLAAF